MQRDYIGNTFTTDIFIEVVHLLTNKTAYAHLLTLPVVLTSLGYRGNITLENLDLTTHCYYSTLDVEWGNFNYMYIMTLSYYPKGDTSMDANQIY